MARGNNNSGRGGNISPIEIARHLKGVDFPATAQDLRQAAEESGANEEVLNFFKELPEGQEFNSPTDVTQQMSGGSSGNSGNNSSKGNSSGGGSNRN